VSEQAEHEHMDTAALGTRMDRLEEKLDQLLSGLHGKAEKREEAHLDRPTTVEEQVRAELKRAEEERAAADAAAAKEAETETIAQRLAKLEERPPVQPQPRRQRIMWGPRS
jgi:hypothetical protein